LFCGSFSAALAIGISNGTKIATCLPVSAFLDTFEAIAADNQMRCLDRPHRRVHGNRRKKTQPI